MKSDYQSLTITRRTQTKDGYILTTKDGPDSIHWPVSKELFDSVEVGQKVVVCLYTEKG